MGKYFADVHASHESQLQDLPHGLADTDEILACRAKPQTYENILELADALCWQLRFREAIDALTQAVKLEPERMEAYRKRGPKYLDTLQFERALADYTRCEQADGVSVESRYRIGMAQYMLQNYDAATAAFAGSLAIAPQDDDMYIADVYWLVLSQLRAEKADEAQKTLKQHYRPDMYVGHHTAYEKAMRVPAGFAPMEDMLAELDYSHIPNFDLIADTYKNLSYDPENRYTVPYTWGTLGIIYNTTMVSQPITSWSAMFDPQYAGQVLMINNSRDALAAALLYLGYSINTTDESQLEEAFALLKQAKDSGVYQAFVMDEVFQKMEGGNAAVAMYYAGDYLTMLENNEDLAFVIPEEGSNWFVDAMCVLKSSQHMSEAEEWINFIASTKANLANMDYIWYASPNGEALEEYPAYYEEVNEEPLDPEIYEVMAPSEEVLRRCEIYENLPTETLRLYDRLWTRLGV